MKLLDKNVTVFPYILSGWLQILVKDPSVVPAAAGCSDLALTWPRRCWRLAAPSAMLFGKLNIIYIFNDITSPRPLHPPSLALLCSADRSVKAAKMSWDVGQVEMRFVANICELLCAGRSIMVTSVFFGVCYHAGEADTSKTDTNCGWARLPASSVTAHSSAANWVQAGEGDGLGLVTGGVWAEQTSRNPHSH